MFLGFTAYSEFGKELQMVTMFSLHMSVCNNEPNSDRFRPHTETMKALRS